MQDDEFSTSTYEFNLGNSSFNSQDGTDYHGTSYWRFSIMASILKVDSIGKTSGKTQDTMSGLQNNGQVIIVETPDWYIIVLI